MKLSGSTQPVASASAMSWFVTAGKRPVARSAKPKLPTEACPTNSNGNKENRARTLGDYRQRRKLKLLTKACHTSSNCNEENRPSKLGDFWSLIYFQADWSV